VAKRGMVGKGDGWLRKGWVEGGMGGEGDGWRGGWVAG
jgi:hypothetical protein